MKKRSVSVGLMSVLLVWSLGVVPGMSAPTGLVPFQLVSEKLNRPLADRDVYIFNGDYMFDGGQGFDPYPCDRSAEKLDWYVATVRADMNGRFNFKVGSADAMSLYFKPGRSYRAVQIEKSSDISHTPSDSHIRIVRFEKGQTAVVRNDIYDLKTGTVRKIWLDGKVEEEPYADVILAVQSE